MNTCASSLNEMYWGVLLFVISRFFRITFPEKPSIGVKRKHPDTGGDIDKPKQLLVQPFTIPNRGPYPYNLPKKYVIMYIHVRQCC